ncbi:cysteine desulfurase family protein [Candidatus Nitrosocosmicus franklandus]|uniref:cysteine desulfurase n=1 Tax=Candidatus Nitrosocosmicus franklandianus TaxID=1798806 RepID=A0A484IGD9_9ARCH|nr:cysteine desulfurase family protein [Candidatus Nitrosocosmicus franklandus]VFJ15072.1 Cysteine desulfurase IscS [Candidatus Nitrosocosmicus franklandus]
MNETSRVYLDNAASTPVDPAVIEAMMPFMVDHFGNPSSLHGSGRKASVAISKARSQVAKLINANPNEIYFTSGGTESNNLALVGYAKMVKRHRPDCNKILISEIEHESILETVSFLEKDLKFNINFIRTTSDGFIDLNSFGNLLSPETCLVSVMLVNNEIGTIQPVQSMINIIKKRQYKTIFHSDGVQALGKIPIDVRQMKLDMLSISSHKINGPKGIGALYIRKGISVEPILYGGGQEMSMRSGTENVYSIVGFGKACEIWKNRLQEANLNIKKLQDYTINRIINEIPESKINGSLQNRVVNNVNFSFKGINGEDLLVKLDEFGIEVSTGSACSSNKKKKESHVLRSLGLPHDEIAGSIRLSLGYQNTKTEMDFAINVLKNVINEFRNLNWSESSQGSDIVTSVP